MSATPPIDFQKKCRVEIWCKRFESAWKER
jgi:hypothetical protein